MCPDVDGLVSKTKKKTKALLKPKEKYKYKAKTSSSMALFRNEIEALQVLREFGEFKNHTGMYIFPGHASNCAL